MIIIRKTHKDLSIYPIDVFRRKEFFGNWPEIFIIFHTKLRNYSYEDAIELMTNNDYSKKKKGTWFIWNNSFFFFLQKSDFDEKFLRSENLKYAELSIRMHDDSKSARNVFRYMWNMCDVKWTYCLPNWNE